MLQYIPELFTTWFPIAGTNYTGTSFMISQGAHTLQHVDPTVTFSVLVYGNADKESYGFAAGMRLARINAVSGWQLLLKNIMDKEQLFVTAVCFYLFIEPLSD